VFTGLGFKVQGAFLHQRNHACGRSWGVEGQSGCRTYLEGTGFRVQGLGFRV
jgi:hypothetical protein